MATSMAREFVEGWTLAHTLGEGAYGEVKLVINRSSGEAVAMKMIDLKKHPDAKVSVRKEVCIQKMLQDPHILRFFGQRSQGDVEYIFLEYASGGELFDRIEPDVGMCSYDAQRYFKQLLLGVQYLHSRGVAHRDLKPENLLLDQHDNLKISDFGMATMFRMKGRERLLDKRCGTLPYVAPEVLVKPYSAEPADIWSCGIILVAMLAGELPWDQPSTSCSEYASWQNDLYTALTPWTKLDTLVLSLLRKVLAHAPKNRPTLSNIIGHRWCEAQFTQESVKSVDVVDSPLKKKSCNNLSPDEEVISSRQCLSQPTRYVTNSLADDILHNRVEISFSQPTLMDDLVLGSQLNLTQGTQNAFQRLVKRMTRFFVSGGSSEALKRLITSVEKHGYSWKTSEGMLTISTMDRRKMLLVFKCNIIEMDDKILLDFRLSKGCGLEFKRSFVKIKNSLSDIIVKGAAPWPMN